MSSINTKSVRFNYESCLEATARLCSYANSTPMLNTSVVNERQTLLAANDLVVFALHARRLITDLDMEEIAQKAIFASYDRKDTFSVWKILNIVIHNENLEIIRTEFELKLKTLGHEYIIQNLAHLTMQNMYAQPIEPLVSVKSDSSKLITFSLTVLSKLFVEKVLEPIVEKAQDNGLYLDPFFDDV